jgi:predicted ATPase/class 3 adenylate cyclase
MTDLPTGTITFLYTDIEGSTRLWEQQPAEMHSALQRHDAILRQAIEANAGQVFRTVGDAFCAAFSAAPQAVAGAVEAQRLLYAEAWQLERPIRVRIALHTGAAEVQNGDYVGSSLNRIGRLLPVCYGGQTLLTQATEQLARDHLPVGVRLLDLGGHRFRDLVQPERIYQLVMPELPERFPPLKTLDTIPNNLPPQLTSFIGRQRELEEIGSLLKTNRLVTLTGPGGTGKTRLSLQSAAASLESFPDGAWLVELAPLADPALVPQSVASVLSLREKPGQTLLEVLQEYLCERSLLLVLDNCEHLVETCALLAGDLLHACPRLKVMASSREALGIAGEIAYQVPSLSLPRSESTMDVEELLKYEAVRLFVERATAVNTHFVLNAQNAASVVQICRRLDGVPLAIELASARVKIFSPEQIARRLDDRFRLLTGGSRTALPRQQTLQALIDWSYDLLSEQEKTLFRRLSVFAGGWSFEAAETICSGEFGPGLGIETGEILDLLASLANKSLVMVDDLGDETRYRYLETVRQYASEKILGSGEAARVRDLHLAYYAARSYQGGKIRYRFLAENSEWIAWVEREQDNLRLAQEWALEHDPEKALQMVLLGSYWGQSGFGTEILGYTRRARERAESLSDFHGEITPLRQELLSLSWMTEGGLLLSIGEYPASIEALNHSLALSRPLRSDMLVATALGLMTVAYSLSGKAQEAVAVIEEGTTLARRLDDLGLLSLFISSRARTLLQLQGYAAAHEMLLQSMAEFDRDESQYSGAMVRLMLGETALLAGDHRSAQRSYNESNAIFTRYGDRQFMTVSLSGMADVARATGDLPGATSLYCEVIANWVTMGNRGAVARCLECLAFIALQQAKEGLEGGSTCLHRAANLFGAAAALRTTNRSDMSIEERKEYDIQLARLQNLLEPADFSAAWAAGQALDITQAVAFAGQSGELLAWSDQYWNKENK